MATPITDALINIAPNIKKLRRGFKIPKTNRMAKPVANIPSKI